MKKKLSIILVAVTVIFFAGLYIYDYRVSHASFKDLEVSQIKTISVYSLSGMMKETLSEDEVAYLVGLLKKVEFDGRSDIPVSRYTGGYNKMFHIELKGQTPFDFAAGNPIYTINTTIGFKAPDYHICAAVEDAYFDLTVKHSGEPGLNHGIDTEGLYKYYRDE